MSYSFELTLRIYQTYRIWRFFNEFHRLGTIRSSREKAEMFWDQIMIDKPEVFGEENPFNELIKRAQKDAFGFNQC